MGGHQSPQCGRRSIGLASSPSGGTSLPTGTRGGSFVGPSQAGQRASIQRSPVISGCRSSTARHQRPQCYLQHVLSEPSAASRKPRLRPQLRSASASSGEPPDRASALFAALELQKRQPMRLAWLAPKPKSSQVKVYSSRRQKNICRGSGSDWRRS